LENRYYDFKGLNLSFETLDGLIKHNGPVYDLLNLNQMLGNNFFKKKINFKNSPSLEAQIASISDDIAYNSHDLEDGLRARLFKLSDLKNLPVLNIILKKHNKKLKKYSADLVLRQIIREIISEMVKDVILNTKKNIKKNNIKNIYDVYSAKYPIVCFSKRMNLFDLSIKKFLRNKMYFHNSVITKTNFGKKVVKNLFLKVKKDPSKYVDIKNIKKANRDRVICDFIAGMTDRYAINLYNKSK
jgi:dGTPase